jgi:hypothetical protein
MPNPASMEIQTWPIDKLVPYARNPRKNEAVVELMCNSIREFGFKIPCLVRGDGELIDGHLRLKAVRKLGMTEIPVIVCDEWTPAQVRAFRLLANRSATWADWDEELLAVELAELQKIDFDLTLTGFDVKELDDYLLHDPPDLEAAPPLPAVAVTRLGDLWLCGAHRVLCGDATDGGAVSRLLGERQPLLLVTDPPYGIELDSEWRDRAGLNGCGPAEGSYMKKKRTKGHRETSISGDTRADWSEAFALVPSHWKANCGNLRRGGWEDRGILKQKIVRILVHPVEELVADVEAIEVIRQRRQHDLPNAAGQADHRMVTLQQPAGRQGVSERHVRSLIEQNVLPTFQAVPCAPWEISLDALNSPAVQEAIVHAGIRKRPPTPHTRRAVVIFRELMR